MIARGFKPVGWVAAIAGAALGCYMLSLNVAAERAELAKIERQIVIAKQDIRTLQTELGTRGRLTQLEQWNAEVLALSAPNAAQFLENEVVLARFETKEPTIEDRAKVQMAAAQVPTPKPAPKLAPADYAAAAEAAAKEAKPLIHQASFTGSVRPPVIKAAFTKSDRSLGEEQKKVAAPKPATLVGKPEAVTKPAETKPVKLAEAKKVAPVKKAKAAPASSTGMLDDSLLKELGEASRHEQAAAGAGAR
jgi:hypothetical protein